MRSTLCRKVFLLAAGFAVYASQAVALPVHVSFEWPSGTPPAVRTSARIQAVRAAGLNANSTPIETEAGPNGAVLNLSDGVWQVQASAPGYWSQGAELTIRGKAPADARLVFWPAASLHGVIATAGGETLPDSLEVRLSATPASVVETTTAQIPIAQAEPGPSHADLHCPINAGTWSCLAPAGLFDVRLEAAGYAPSYEWGVSLKTAESSDLGRTELRRTASVFGQVVRKDGSNPPGPCRATLHPDMERQGPTAPDQEPETGADAKMRFSIPLTPRGYFQVVGVAPGRYALAVGCHAASGFRMLRVQANGETRLDPPLQLEELTLDVAVVPRVDPAGQPWKLAVYATAPHYLRIADGATTSAEGRWIRHGLMAGNYRVVVRGSDGAEWLQQYFDLNKSTGLLSLRVGAINVAGRVMMSSQPVRASLVFSNNAGGESATLNSDNDGRFQGLLPVAAGGQESTWTVEASVAQPPVTQRLLNVSVQPTASTSTWLDLQLPAVAVHGSVASPDGKPQSNIEVTFEDTSGVRTTTSTDDAGRFEMPDLPPGKYTAAADSPDGSSDRTPFEVTEGSSRELKLVLNPFNRYSFNVVSNQGPVADAAVQVWIKPGMPRAFVRTDDNGRFEVSLPPGTTEVGLTIGAQGYALKLTRLPISSDSSDDSQDAHTITLDTSAGTLVLNFQSPGRGVYSSTTDSSAADSFDTLYLVHNGAIQDARTIVGWGTDQAGANINGPAIVDMIEPGDYALCRVDPAQVSVLWSGPPPPDRCRKGSLDENETLTLAPR